MVDRGKHVSDTEHTGETLQEKKKSHLSHYYAGFFTVMCKDNLKLLPLPKKNSLNFNHLFIMCMECLKIFTNQAASVSSALLKLTT